MEISHHNVRKRRSMGVTDAFSTLLHELRLERYSAIFAENEI
jgi:hypothetical protein